MRAGLSRTALVALASLATASAAAVVPVAAASAAERTEALTVLLAPSDQAGFDALLTIKGLAQRDRSSFLAQVGPTRGARSTVVSRLTALGLHVESSNGWTVKASGPASVVDAFLGDRAAQRRAQTAAARAGRRVTATSSVPAALTGLARAVIGGNDTTPIAHPLTAQTGSDIRTLYHATAGAPVSGHSALTVATLQLATWDPTDLRTFASSQGLPDPLAGQYTGIAIDSGCSVNPNQGSGPVEVALDQESLLAAAPEIRQRAYFAQNCDLGFFDAVTAVANDAVGSHPGIVALSISWGGCEAEWGATVMDIMSTAFQQAVASGVTVFAASGDTGIFGCQSNPSAVAVDYPASDPYVVGVGGTTVLSSSSETAWSSNHPVRDGASGGGVSAHWGHPSWQSGTARRQVPDVAAVGAPSSGMIIYSSNARCTSSNNHLGTHHCQVGGTSLSSPLFAGSFAATLADLGFDSGIGDIHAALYSAPSSAFRDITTGFNGYAAGPGYDRVTGLGSPLWDQLAAQLATPLAATVAQAAPGWTSSLDVPLKVTPSGSVSYAEWASGAGGTAAACSTVVSASVPSVVHVSGEGARWVWVEGKTPGGRCDVGRTLVHVDQTLPSVSAKIGLTTGLTTSVTASWKGADNAALDHYSIAITHSGSSTPDVQGTTGKATYAFVGKAGYTYRVTVTAVDKAGNVSAPATAKLSVPLDDKAFALSAWKRTSDRTAFGGSYVLASSTKAKASRTVSGRSYTALFTTCSTCGTANIYVGRTLVKTVNLYSARTHARVAFVVAAYGSTGSRAITVRPTGKKSVKSKGTQVRFDAVVAGS